jgi:hypothetical protein
MVPMSETLQDFCWSDDFNFSAFPPPQTAPPYLQIDIQPHVGPYRFRYESELKKENHGSILGVQQHRGTKTYPLVSLKNFNFDLAVTIRCSLWQVTDSDKPRKPHCNSLSQKIKTFRKNPPIEVEVTRVNNFTAR